MGRVLSAAELSKQVEIDRASGKTIAMANGCFDVIHVGHVRYLAGAATEADRLVVAINDDLSVSILKGEGRPVVPAVERAELVAAFTVVDYVILFSTSTVAELLRLLRPDVHCKGTDYSVETVPERDIVQEYGGKTVIVGDPKNHSTEKLIQSITESASRTIGTTGKF